MEWITGEKIVLRPYRDQDADAVFQAVNNPQMRRLTGTQATFNMDQIQRYIANYTQADDRAGFVIALPDSLEPVGEVVINEIDPDNHSANIRITLFYEADFSKGYGSDALRLMVDYGFKTLHLHRISLGVFAFNPRAIHVYKKIGFKQEGVLRDTLFYEGEFHDEIIMSILEHEWQPLL